MHLQYITVLTDISNLYQGQIQELKKGGSFERVCAERTE